MVQFGYDFALFSEIAPKNSALATESMEQIILMPLIYICANGIIRFLLFRPVVLLYLRPKSTSFTTILACRRHIHILTHGDEAIPYTQSFKQKTIQISNGILLWPFTILIVMRLLQHQTYSFRSHTLPLSLCPCVCLIIFSSPRNSIWLQYLHVCFVIHCSICVDVVVVVAVAMQQTHRRIDYNECTVWQSVYEALMM